MDTKQYIIDELEKLTSDIIGRIQVIRTYAKSNNLLNSQVYLDFEDKLNKISVMDPNK